MSLFKAAIRTRKAVAIAQVKEDFMMVVSEQGREIRVARSRSI
jgi:hypothetical protein